MAAPESISIAKIAQAIKSLQNNIAISSDFHAQVAAIRLLLGNDESGLVNSILDFMVNAANTSFKIETKNPNLDKNLEVWQKSLVNKNLGVDIPRGLKELSTEYFRERWTTSLIALNINWQKV